jgi:hypothetical protein
MILIQYASTIADSAFLRHLHSRQDLNRQKGSGMRILLAVLAIALLAGTADAQEMGGRGGKGRGPAPNGGDQQKTEQQKKQIDDAYKSAIGRIPDPKTKYDPWKTAR